MRPTLACEAEQDLSPRGSVKTLSQATLTDAHQLQSCSMMRRTSAAQVARSLYHAVSALYSLG